MSNTPPDLPAPGGRMAMDLPFHPVRIAVLTVSDTRTLDNDTSGHILAERVKEAGHVLADRAILKDDKTAIAGKVSEWIADPEVDAVISTGGTGLTGRDVTPEAVMPLFEKHIEGFAVVWHMVSYQSVGLSTLQSRACAGLRTAPSSSACRAPTGPAGTAGTRLSDGSSTAATCPATWWN